MRNERICKDTLYNFAYNHLAPNRIHGKGLSFPKPTQDRFRLVDDRCWFDASGIL